MRSLLFIIFIVACGCNNKSTDLKVYPINEQINNSLEYRKVQYFYIDNYNNLSLESLSNSLLLFSDSQINISEFKTKSYVQYFYKKNIFKNINYRVLVESSEGDPQGINSLRENLICQIRFNKVNEIPMIYSRTILLYDKDSIVYEKSEYIVKENNKIKKLDEKEYLNFIKSLKSNN